MPLRVDVANGKLAALPRRPCEEDRPRAGRRVAHAEAASRRSRTRRSRAGGSCRCRPRRSSRSRSASTSGRSSCRTRSSAPKVTEDDLGQVIVIKRDSKKLLFFNGDTLKRVVPRRDGPVVVPDADRQVRDRHDAAQPVVVSRRRARPGPRARADPARARATRSARAGWASRRRTSASTGRPTPRRSATPPRTAASGC